MCDTLLAPSNGSLTCSNGSKNNSTCSYSCDEGYQLIGSSQRTCQLSRFWSGVSTHCHPLQCPQLNPPDNGYIQLPCSHDYLSKCSVRCFDGYNIINGSDTVKCCLINTTTVEWTPFGKCKSKVKSHFSFLSSYKIMLDCYGLCIIFLIVCICSSIIFHIVVLVYQNQINQKLKEEIDFLFNATNLLI